MMFFKNMDAMDLVIVIFASSMALFLVGSVVAFCIAAANPTPVYECKIIPGEVRQ
jgi:hypothetical protein